MSSHLTIAHWVTNLSYPLKSIDEWVALLCGQLQKAAAEQADILLAPEHVGEHWMHFAPADLTPAAEIGWIADNMAAIRPKLQDAVTKTGVALVAGSSSYRHETTGICRNRSWMFFPDRAPLFHDKLVLTPSEQEAEGWNFEKGDHIPVFTWRGFKIALVICLDVEMPAVSHMLASQDIDLLLVPSMTTKLAGYHRVFSCARARAVELMAAVAVVGCIGGTTKAGQLREAYHGGAAVYIPSEEVFGHTGIFSDLPAHNVSEDAGTLFISRDIPLADIRRVRHGRPEAWPGPFDSNHISILAF